MLAAESSSNWQTIKLKSHHEYIQCNSVRIDDDLSDIEDVVIKWCMYITWMNSAQFTFNSIDVHMTRLRYNHLRELYTQTQ